MAGIMEQPGPINDAEDYVVQYQCGCKVTFLGETTHRTERMDPCNLHSGNRWQMWRRRKRDEARQRLEMAKLQQPPR